MAGAELGASNMASTVTVFKMRYEFTSFYDPLSSLAKIT